MKTAMAAMLAHADLELQLVVGGALLNRQTAISDEIRHEGFTVAASIDYMQDDESPLGIGVSAARCLSQATELLIKLRPDVLVVIADRYEALVLAQAALYTNVRIAHLEGGELSGSIDERIRHAITKLAHYHFPASEDAAKRIRSLGERAESVATVGSPSFDLVADSDGRGLRRLHERLASGRAVDLDKPFLLVSQHPVVTQEAQAEAQYRVLFESLLRLNMPTILIWPNNDAGAGAIRGPLASFKEQAGRSQIAIVGALPIEEYGAALRRALCLVGNSSSGIRESAFLGTPVVNIGTRQSARARGANVIDVDYDTNKICAAVRQQITHGRYQPDRRYGDGQSGQRIAEFLASYWPPLDKAMVY
jgi:UDP-hydrolysing UDP-N-acetyl-D-glucosamine 2-epimerase